MSESGRAPGRSQGRPRPLGGQRTEGAQRL